MIELLNKARYAIYQVVHGYMHPDQAYEIFGKIKMTSRVNSVIRMHSLGFDLEIIARNTSTTARHVRRVLSGYTKKAKKRGLI